MVDSLRGRRVEIVLNLMQFVHTTPATQTRLGWLRMQGRKEDYLWLEVFHMLLTSYLSAHKSKNRVQFVT